MIATQTQTEIEALTIAEAEAADEVNRLQGNLDECTSYLAARAIEEELDEALWFHRRAKAAHKSALSGVEDN
jgi:hypothetical protein